MEKNKSPKKYIVSTILSKDLFERAEKIKQMTNTSFSSISRDGFLLRVVELEKQLNISQ